MKKVRLFATLASVALVGAIGAGSTFAYLTDSTEAVTNTFTVGEVAFEYDENDETVTGLRESEVKRDENTGDYVDADKENTWTKTENIYEDLVAGEKVYKDPTVIMDEKSQIAWVFARIENVNNEAFANIEWNTKEWIDVTAQYKELNPADNADYAVYARKEKINPEEASTIFTSVTLSDDVTGETVIPQIIVKAFAIQAVGFNGYMDAIDEVTFK